MLGRDLEGTEIIDEMAASVAGYAPAIEVVDSRFHDYKFHWLDNVADNSSSAAYVVGARKQVCDVAAIKARLHLDGELIDEGESSDDGPSPGRAGRGRPDRGRSGPKLRAGMVILTGGITRAHPIAPGKPRWPILAASEASACSRVRLGRAPIRQTRTVATN